MSDAWSTTTLTSVTEALSVLSELRGRRWLCRGQSKRYGGLVPSIDREELQSLSRVEKLALERQSIDLFRSTARFFADAGEQGSLASDIIALMVLRHYDVPTRLLDWSMSPWVAAYFAARHHPAEDAEIWSLDEPRYELEGRKQWARWPETTSDGSGDGSKWDARLTAFSRDEPPDWFVCAFYGSGFPRQNAQEGVYSMTARFGRDHGDAIARLLGEPSRYHLYIIDARLKPELLANLREKHGIWRGSLYPDSAGAAATACSVFPGKSI